MGRNNHDQDIDQQKKVENQNRQEEIKGKRQDISGNFRVFKKGINRCQYKIYKCIPELITLTYEKALYAEKEINIWNNKC